MPGTYPITFRTSSLCSGSTTFTIEECQLASQAWFHPENLGQFAVGFEEPLLHRSPDDSLTIEIRDDSENELLYEALRFGELRYETSSPWSPFEVDAPHRLFSTFLDDLELTNSISVRIVFAGCEISNSFEVPENTVIETEPCSLELSVYPSNPTSYLSAKVEGLDESSDYVLTFYNQYSGEELNSRSFSGSSSSTLFKVGGLPEGTYIVRATQGACISSDTFVK